MVAVTVRTDGMAIGVGRLLVTVTIDRSRRMRRFQFDDTGRSIDGRDQNEHGDDQRQERRHDAVTGRQSNHAVL